jgi:hypothetical protein
MDDKLKENSEDYFKIKIEPLDEISLEHRKYNDWDFFWSSQKMLSGKELDMISDRLKVHHLPEMFYGYNRFYLIYSKADFMIEINPIDMMELTSYAERQSKFFDKEKIKSGLFNPEKDDPKFIYYMPPDVKVQYFDKWKNLKVDRDDIKTMNPVQDWSFTSSYMGNILKLSGNKLIESKHFTDFDLMKNYSNPDIKYTEESLPVHMLGRDNPIVDYMEINLYEDELCDNGQTKANFR